MVTSLAVNKRASFDYEILETFEAGLQLKGYEVKAIKTGHISLKGSFVTAKSTELYLTNALIPLYQHTANIPAYEPTNSRKLLLHRKEISFLIGKIHTEGLTLIPLSVYNKKGKIKLKFALARGKKKYDKRQAIKQREAKRRILSTLRA